MKIKYYILLLFFTLLSLKNFATHIVGGEIYYDCLGGNNYRITLKLYRDCYNGIALYDNPATIFVFDSLGTYLDSIYMAFPGSDTLPFPLSNPCLTPPTNICVEEAIYQTTINLPPLAGGYNLVYERCCRNGTILNLVNPGAVGSTYMAHIPDPGLATCNNSPHYNNFPPIFLCAGVPLNFDHSATDPDGDSLHYELCDPYTGLTASCPILGPQTPGGCSAIAAPPPYPFVPWLSPYTGSYPMSSSPALAVDPATGLMTGTPNMIGQWVIGVCVEEYRNGILLSTNKRDFQFNVVNCGIPIASIPTQQPFCFGMPSNFSQNSINAFTYHWDFGEAGLTNDTSNLFSPSWTYSALGTYTVTLIVNPGTLCTDTATIPVTVYPLPSMTSSNSATVCSGNTLNIPLTSTEPSNFSWIAANNANTTGESTTQQTNATINDAIANNSSSVQTVLYTVTPTSTPQGCVGNPQTVTVTINPAPAMTSPPAATICNGVTVNMPLTSTIAATYSWIAANNPNTSGESISQQTNDSITDAISNASSSIQQVTYTVTPTSTSNGCTGTPQNVVIDVMPDINITSPPSASICSGVSLSIALTSNVSSTYTWVAANNSNTTGESTTQQTGSPINDAITNNISVDQTVSYTVTPTSNAGGCIGNPQTLTVTVNPAPTMTSPNTTTICNGDITNLLLTSDLASTYAWMATDNSNTTGESITLQAGSSINDTINNNTPAVQNVLYTITPTSTPQGCAGNPQTITVTVNPSPAITSPATATICTGVAANMLLASTIAATYTWVATDNLNTTGESTGLQTSNTITDTIINISSSLQQVSYIVTPTSTSNGCNGTPQNVIVDVIPPPVITSPSTASICSGNTVTVPLTSNTTSTYTWVATDNPNTIGESTTNQSGTPLSNTITNNASSDQLVAYTIIPTSTPDGCLGTPFTMTVTIYPGITADFDFVKVPCIYQVSFNDSSVTAPVSWLWYFGDGDSSALQNPSHTYDTIGVYDIQLIATTATGCSDTTIVQLDFVGPNPVSVSSNTTICSGNSTQLLASGGIAYSWSPAAGLSDSTIANPVATPDDTTNYTVTISTADTFGDTCSQTLTTTVYSIDASQYTISASADNDTILEDQSTTLHATTDSSLTVIWSPSAEMTNPNLFDQTISPTTTTTYYVSILDSVGCPKTDSITIYVVSIKCEAEDVFVPNTFTPNGDGNNDVLYVRGNEIKKIYFAVYNRRGELVFETYDITKGWDGTYQGKKSDPDVFAWYIMATCYSDAKLEKKGNITLIR